MEFFDTHCHIHDVNCSDEDDLVRNKWSQAGVTDARLLVDEATQAGVKRLICVGCTLQDSARAVDFVEKYENSWASIGIHPHEAKDHLGKDTQTKFADLLARPKVVAIGECGLDFYYNHSTKTDQYKVLEFQLDLAKKHNLPVIFHVRDAFNDFWSIFDNFKNIRGVIHSFSASTRELDQIISRNLFVGLNGIMTFTKDPKQLIAAKAVPLDKLLLETDAPFLTPAPLRGTICMPKHVVQTAEFLAGLRDEDMAKIAQITTQNACNLFFNGK